MLKYSIKLVTTPELNPINYRELYLAKDLSYISGVTDYYEGIKDGEEVSISSPYLTNGVRRPIKLTLVRRQGYVLTEEKYPIQKIENVGDEKEDVYYVEYNGDYYYRFNNFSVEGFLIDGFLRPSNVDRTVTIPTKHWIENGKVEIKGERYYVDTNLIKNENFNNGYEYPTIKKYGDNSILEKVDGTEIKVVDYEYSKWHNVYKFVIESKGKEEILVEGATTGDYFPFVSYNGETYSIKEYDEGYGVLIDKEFYPMSGATSLEEFTTLDDPSITIGNEALKVYTTFKSDGDGSILVLYTQGENHSFKPYDSIVAESDDSYFTEKVSKAKNGNLYVEYDGARYLVEPNVCDEIRINDNDYRIAYTNAEKTLGYITINDEKIYFSIKDKVATIKDQIYYLNDKNIVEFGSQSNSSKESGFTVTEISGITLDNGDTCPIFAENAFIKDDVNLDEYNLYCLIRGPKKYELQIFGLEGSKSLYCSAIPSVDDIFEQKRINSEIRDNIEHYHFYFKSELFGDAKISPLLGADESLKADHPISTRSILPLYKDLVINQVNDYITLPIGLGTKVDTTINKDDIVQNDFVKDKTEESINHVVDMEKDIYHPALKTPEGFKPIEELVFNLHFRTRDLESWKVVQDNSIEIGELSATTKSEGATKSEVIPLIYTTNGDTSNWFVTDYFDYKNKIYNESEAQKLHMSSDLLGLLNFTDDDVKYRKKKIAKSFLRLSFYSTKNPQTQVLLATSTIFMDENKCFKKMMDNNSDKGKIFKTIQLKEDLENVSLSDSISVMSELYDEKNATIKLDDDSRLDSRIIVKDKYNTETSSEGFYLYLFREYSSKLREGTVYMKVDFCHAGNGLTIPFIIPTTSDGGSPIYLNNYFDLAELKEGIPLNKVYDNLYIPIKVIYSEADKKYWYYLPSNYVENAYLGLGEEDDNKMMFNLFELKIRDQSYETDF